MLQNSSSDDEEEDDKTEGTVCSLQQQGSSRGDICLPWGGGGCTTPWTLETFLQQKDGQEFDLIRFNEQRSSDIELNQGPTRRERCSGDAWRVDYVDRYVSLQNVFTSRFRTTIPAA